MGKMENKGNLQENSSNANKEENKERFSKGIDV
jgi:hypothetical protein